MTTSDIKERLRGYNTPDRTLDNQRHIAVDIHDALNEIERLERELAALQEESRQWDKTSLVAILARAEKAERELAEKDAALVRLQQFLRSLPQPTKQNGK